MASATGLLFRRPTTVYVVPVWKRPTAQPQKLLGEARLVQLRERHNRPLVLLSFGKSRGLLATPTDPALGVRFVGAFLQ